MTISTLVKKIDSLSRELYGKAIIDDMLYAMDANEASLIKNRDMMLSLIKDMKDRLNILETSLTLGGNKND